jgi:hypothetical protein
MIADWAQRWIPGPFQPAAPLPPIIWPYPQTVPNFPPPAPVWPIEMLDQFEDLLQRVKKLEDAAGGCANEDPRKLDYLKEIRKLITRRATHER